MSHAYWDIGSGVEYAFREYFRNSYFTKLRYCSRNFSCTDVASHLPGKLMLCDDCGRLEIFIQYPATEYFCRLIEGRI